MLRSATSDDIVAVLALAEDTGLLQPHELEDFGGMIREHLEGESETDFWVVDDEGDLRGAAYYAPEQFSDGVWNLYFIGVHPTHQGKGCGSALLNYVEKTLKEQGQRLLLVETSGLNSFEQTRMFYRKNGYDEEARIRDFYKLGDDKVIFRKDLTATTR